MDASFNRNTHQKTGISAQTTATVWNPNQTEAQHNAHCRFGPISYSCNRCAKIRTTCVSRERQMNFEFLNVLGETCMCETNIWCEIDRSCRADIFSTWILVRKSSPGYIGFQWNIYFPAVFCRNTPKRTCNPRFSKKEMPPPCTVHHTKHTIQNWQVYLGLVEKKTTRTDCLGGKTSNRVANLCSPLPNMSNCIEVFHKAAQQCGMVSVGAVCLHRNAHISDLAASAQNVGFSVHFGRYRQRSQDEFTQEHEVELMCESQVRDRRKRIASTNVCTKGENVPSSPERHQQKENAEGLSVFWNRIAHFATESEPPHTNGNEKRGNAVALFYPSVKST